MKLIGDFYTDDIVGDLPFGVFVYRWAFGYNVIKICYCVGGASPLGEELLAILMMPGIRVDPHTQWFGRWKIWIPGLWS